MILFLGAPTGTGTLPVISWAPEERPTVELRPLTEAVVEDIARLHNTRLDQHRTLWEDTEWTHRVARGLIPEHLYTRPATSPGEQLVLLTHQTLSHVPFEALDLDGTPLGVKYATARLTAPTATPRPAPKTERTVAYFDPALDWTPERLAIAAGPAATTVDTPTDLHRLLGPATLTLAACHGSAGPGLTGHLRATDGTRVLDALDVLAHDLTGGILLLEACSSGRIVGHNYTEPLSLASAALVAGASAVVAGTLPLPADPACTGQIHAAAINHLADGIPPAEALRLARGDYLANPPDTVRLPGPDTTARMPGRSPWAWAGAAVFI